MVENNEKRRVDRKIITLERQIPVPPPSRRREDEEQKTQHVKEVLEVSNKVNEVNVTKDYVVKKDEEKMPMPSLIIPEFTEPNSVSLNIIHDLHVNEALMTKPSIITPVFEGPIDIHAEVAYEIPTSILK